MPMVDMQKGPPPRPIRGLLPLRAIERYPMSVGQSASIVGAPPDAVSAAFSAALDSGGFSLVPVARPTETENGGGLVSGRTVFAERNVRRVATHAGMIVSMSVIFGAGVALGAVDGILVGGIWYTFPWFFGGAAAAGLLWWRYGRTYESEVIAVQLLGSSPTGLAPASRPGSVASGTVVFKAGRVRSVAFSGTRTAVGVLDCPISLMESLGGVVRRFQSELGLPATAELRGTAS